MCAGRVGEGGFSRACRGAEARRGSRVGFDLGSRLFLARAVPLPGPASGSAGWAGSQTVAGPGRAAGSGRRVGLEALMGGAWTRATRWGSPTRWVSVHEPRIARAAAAHARRGEGRRDRRCQRVGRRVVASRIAARRPTGGATSGSEAVNRTASWRACTSQRQDSHTWRCWSTLSDSCWSTSPSAKAARSPLRAPHSSTSMRARTPNRSWVRTAPGRTGEP